MRAATTAIVACLLAACPSSRSGHGTEAPQTPDDRELRIAVAHAETESRETGLSDLARIFGAGDRHAKLLVLRAYGRIGGEAGRVLIVPHLEDPDPAIAAGAMAALGVARELDDTSVEDGATIVPQLHAAFSRTSGADRVLAIEALGRAGDKRSQTMLAWELAATPDRAEAAGIALGRQGRRKIELTPPVLTALYTAMQRPEPSVRYAATYALARAVPIVPSPLELGRALIARLGDSDAAVRAQAVIALGKHELLAASPLEKALLDADWHVAVEAVRALTGDKASPDSADAVATALVGRLAAPNGDHVRLEALRGLGKAAARPVVAKALDAIAAWAKSGADLDHAWTACLVAAAQAHATNQLAPVFDCSDKRLPDPLRLPLVADLVGANVGSLAERRAALTTLLAHPDVRVRAAALGALSALWKEGSDADHASAIGILAAAIASPEPILAGSAVDAAAAFYELIGDGDHAALDTALVARAQTETDAELSAALLDLIGKRKLAAGLEACRAGATGAPVRAKAARDCLHALGEATSASVQPTPPPPPPVDVATVIGTQPRWHIVTTRGDLVIALRPDVAPWAVASIVALTKKGAYDGLAFHRVVPDFVVQGGDPTESGWGGPGYTLPAEPATAADGPGFVAGGVGLADAGRDSAGSQWFVMHSRAAHLDGRYTWIGSLVSGQNVADSLQIGDKVVHATIE